MCVCCDCRFFRLYSVEGSIVHVCVIVEGSLVRLIVEGSFVCVCVIVEGSLICGL